MEAFSEQEAMRVLQAGSQLDAARNAASRTGLGGATALPNTSMLPGPSAQHADDALEEDGVWLDLPLTETPGQQRRGDLDSWMDVFRATATSVRNAWRHMDCLTFEGLAFGWLALARKHESLPVTPGASGVEVTDFSPLLRALDEARWAQAAYVAHTAQDLEAELGLQPGSVVIQRAGTLASASSGRPAYFAAVHHASRSLRLVVRGTGHLRDLMTSLAGHSRPLCGGYAHHGMLAAAEALLAEEEGALRQALAAHPGYGLHIIGHSLGAGTAALLALLLGSSSGRLAALAPPGSPPPALRATCLATPPVVTPDVAVQCAHYVDSYVYHADLVSRCSVVSLRRLAAELSAASEEVMARSELAQALRRSGALGLANHLAAAALCRGSQASSEPAFGTHGPPAAGHARPAVSEGLSLLGGALGRATAAAFAQPVAQPSGRLDQLAALGSQLRAAAIVAANAAATAFNAHAVALNPHPQHQQHPYQQQQNPYQQQQNSYQQQQNSYQQQQHQQNQLPPLAPNPGMRAPAGSSSSSEPYGGTTTTRDTLPAVRRPQLEPVTHSTPMAASGATPANGATWAPQFPQPPPGEVPSTPGPGRRRGVLGFFKDLRDMVQQDGRTAAAALAAATAAAATAAAAALVPYGQPSPPQPQPLTMAVGVPVGPGPAPARHGSMVGLPAGTLGPYTPQPPPQPPGSGPVGAFPRRLGSGSEVQAAGQFGGAAVTAPASASSSAAPVPQGPQPSGVPSGGAEGGAQGGQEPAHQFHDLVVPGTVYLIERRGADATASFRLVRDLPREGLSRVLLKRSMLRDHLLSHYMAALEQVLMQAQQAQQQHTQLFQQQPQQQTRGASGTLTMFPLPVQRAPSSLGPVAPPGGQGQGALGQGQGQGQGQHSQAPALGIPVQGFATAGQQPLAPVQMHPQYAVGLPVRTGLLGC